MEEDLRRRYSPEQIVGRLRRQFPDDPEIRVSAETIYQSWTLEIALNGTELEMGVTIRSSRGLRHYIADPRHRVRVLKK